MLDKPDNDLQVSDAELIAFVRKAQEEIEAHGELNGELSNRCVLAAAA
jgi:hypothetical protein